MTITLRTLADLATLALLDAAAPCTFLLVLGHLPVNTTRIPTR